MIERSQAGTLQGGVELLALRLELVWGEIGGDVASAAPN
jgi:hypothetical protein